jgi:hypothetical protein
MDSYLKVASVKKDNQNCNCITPFYMNDISGINPNTNYTIFNISGQQQVVNQITNHQLNIEDFAHLLEIKIIPHLHV